jgi:hypothetical protein
VSDTETVSLNLDGNFASAAEKAASEAEKLDKSLEKLSKPKSTDADGAVRSRLQAEKAVQASILAAQKNAAALSLQIDKQQHEYRLALLKSESAERARAARAAATAEKAAAPPAPVAEKGGGGLAGLLGVEGGGMLGGAAALGAAGGVVAAAASKIIEGAERLAMAAFEVTKAAAALAIAETSKREIGSAVFGKLGGDYEQTVQMALKLGIDPDKATAEAKQLLNAHFKSTEVPVLMRIAAGMDLVQEGSGQELIGKLKEIQLKPKVDAKEIKSLAAMGIDTKAVYAALAKEMGTDVAGAMAKVKAGAADSAQVIKAIEKVAGDQFGGLADKVANSVPALAARVKGDFFQLFNAVNLEPLKDVLKNVAGVLEGPAGQALKKSITELFDALSHAFLDDLRGPDGAKKLEAFALKAADAIHELAGAAKDLKPLGTMLWWSAQGAIELADALAKIAKYKDLWSGGTGGGGFGKDAGGMWNVGGDAMQTAMGQMGDDVSAGALGVGAALPEGLAEGIAANESVAIDAAAAMAAKALAAAKDELGVHSPSQEFHEVGEFSDEGMAKGFVANDNASAGARQMASNALGAAAGEMGAGPGGGAPGAGGGVTIIIQVGGGPNAEATAEAVANRLARMPEFRAAVRRVQRENREAANG